MPKCWPCIVFAILFCVLLFVTSAAAECTWTLWVHEMRYSEAAGRENRWQTHAWSQFGTYLTELECRAAISRALEDLETRYNRSGESATVDLFCQEKAPPSDAQEPAVS